METAGWLDDFGTARVREAFNARMRQRELAAIVARHDDPAYRARDADEIMARKNYHATGATRREDRPLALDLIGVASQLVFPTSPNVWLEGLEHGDDPDLLYGAASATNRAQVAFCSVDPRLLPVGYVPLADLERAPRAAAEALELGCSALLIPWACPKAHATSHVALDAVWAQAADAGAPILLHVGNADRVLPPAHANNGLPRVPDFHGGEENFRSISYMAIPHGPMQALSMLILDGVLDRFETLKIGVIELGAVWLPGFMRQLDAAFEAFARHEERLQALAPEAQRVRPAPGPRHPLPHRARGLDHRAVGTRDLHVLVGLPARRGRPQPDGPVREVHRCRERRGSRAILPGKLRGPDGTGGRRTLSARDGMP